MSYWGGEKARTWRKWLGVGVVAILILHATLSAVLFLAMKQTPMRFAKVMSKLPMASMMVLPFELLST